MRDYGELVKELRESAEWADRLAVLMGRDVGDSKAPLMRKAADAIEELLAAVPEWISVEERLPEPFVSVLVQMPGEKPCPTVREGYIDKEGKWTAGMFRREPGEVTHWREMPQPPKEVE